MEEIDSTLIEEFVSEIVEYLETEDILVESESKTKGRLALFLVRFLPEKKLDEILKSAREKALRIAKTEKDKSRIKKKFSLEKSKKEKRELIREIIKANKSTNLEKADKVVASKIKDAAAKKNKTSLKEELSAQAKGRWIKAGIYTAGGILGAAAGAGGGILLGSSIAGGIVLLAVSVIMPLVSAGIAKYTVEMLNLEE